MFVQKCGLLLMYRVQANLDEEAVVFFYPEKVFFTPLPGLKKSSVFYYNFFFGKR